MKKDTTDYIRVLDQFDSTLSLAEASTLPSEFYTDEYFHERELESIFHQNWVPVARKSEFNVPGDFITTTIANEPLIIFLSATNQHIALSNVCRHKGAVILNEKKGNTKNPRCSYHQWTYNMKGDLIGVPEFQEVKNFDLKKNCLPSFPLEAWGDFLFIHLGKPQNSLRNSFGELFNALDTGETSKLRFYKRKTYPMECNWKVFIDNYLDGGYHVNSIHPSLAKIVDYKHYKSEEFQSSQVQKAPLLTPENESIRSVRQGEMAQYWWLYPNFMINHYEGCLDTHTVTPVSANQCEVVFDFYFTDADDPNHFSTFEKSLLTAHQIQLEDMEVSERVQKGLKSQFYSQGRYSVKREAGAFLFHQLVAKDLRKLI